jgi:hypothetical protein
MRTRRVPTNRTVATPGQGRLSGVGWQHQPARSALTPAAGAAGEEEEVSVADTYNGYCVKCKEKRDFEGRVEVSKTGMKMAKGTCPVCGTTVNRILGKA